MKLDVTLGETVQVLLDGEDITRRLAGVELDCSEPTHPVVTLQVLPAILTVGCQPLRMRLDRDDELTRT